MLYKKVLTSTALSALLFTSAMALENDKVYATVNGEAIKASDIAVVLKDPKINFDVLPQENKKNILDQLVDRKLLALKAMSTDITSTTEYKTTLENTIKTLKQDLALQIWISNLSKEVAVSDKDAQSFYDSNKDKFQQQRQFKANHILVKTEKEAKDIIASLSASKDLKNDFIKTAKEKSTGPSGVNGGDLGWFEPKMMVPEFSQATAMLKKGTITTVPVKTQFGFHVIYLDDKKEASTAPFADVKENIKQHLGQVQFKEKVDAILKDEKAKAKITYTK